MNKGQVTDNYLKSLQKSSLYKLIKYNYMIKEN